MDEITIAQARDDDIRSVAQLRASDETGVRLALELSQCGTAWVAREGSEAFGWALVRADSEQRLVGDLFVHESHRGAGVGSRLLDAALEDSGDGIRAVVLRSGDAAALVLALRRGLRPAATVVRLAGAIPREPALLAMAAGDYRFEVDPIDPLRNAYALEALDLQTRGVAPIDRHRRLCGDGNGLAFYKDGEFVGYAYIWPDGRIGPVAASAAAYMPQLIAYSIVTLARTLKASWCSLLVPSDNLKVARAALRAGLRIADSLTVAADAAPGDLSRYVAYHPLLF